MELRRQARYLRAAVASVVLAVALGLTLGCSFEAASADGVSSDADASRAVTATIKSGVMMQGFYWDVPSGGTWYNTMASKASELANMASGYGIDTIWFPPVSKCDGGATSMGYDPYDYYDLGQLTQKSTTETRFGSQTELKTAIATYKSYGIASMADIILNHRSGGASQTNPVAGGSTWTDFSAVASGKCAWSYTSFHPTTYETADTGTFSGMPDLCYNNASPYTDMQTWMNWLMSTSNAGFTQWRFDYVKGIWPWVVKDMKAATGNPFTVGEYWDSDTSTLNTWCGSANSSAFDFALYYTMGSICNDTTGGGYLPNLVDYTKSFAAMNPTRAVTFVGNHDTDTIITDKMMAYAFILTFQGYPMIWWKDYFDYGLSTSSGLAGNGIKQLVWARGKLAAAAPTIELLKTDDGDCLIYGAKGTSTSAPGYIIVINDNASSWKGATVTTGNSWLKGKTLKAYAWHSSVSAQNCLPNSQACSSSGSVSVWAPPRGYALYSVTGF